MLEEIKSHLDEMEAHMDEMIKNIKANIDRMEQNVLNDFSNRFDNLKLDEESQ